MYKLVKFKLVGYNTLTPNYPRIDNYDELDFNHPALQYYIEKYGEPINFVSNHKIVIGYMDVVAQKSDDGYYTLVINTDNPNSYIIGYLRRFIFKDSLSTEYAGIAVKLPDFDYAVSIFSIYSPGDWEVHDYKYDPPVELRFPKDYVKYGIDAVKITPKVNQSNFGYKLYDKLKEVIVEKKNIIDYPLYVYTVIPKDKYTVTLTAKGDNGKYYPVTQSENNVEIMDLENGFSDVNEITLDIKVISK